MKFDNLLKLLRGDRNLKEISKLTGLSDTYLCQLENGYIKSPGVETLRKLYRAYPVHKKDILVSLGLL